MSTSSEPVTFSRTELVKFLSRLGEILPDGFYADVYVVGGGAMMTFYGFDGMTTDCDVFMDSAIFPEDMVVAVKQVAEENGLNSHWINHDVALIPNPSVDTYIDMKEHIVEDIGWQLYNVNGYHVMTLYPVSLRCICRNKFAPGCFRDKDIRHLEHIALQNGFLYPQDMIGFILEEYPYIEDKIWWDQEIDNIEKFYRYFQNTHSNLY